MPVLMCGLLSMAIPAGMGSLVGTRLNTLSTGNGIISFAATKIHKRQVIHFGIFLHKTRTSIMTRISMSTVMALFNICKKTFSISRPSFLS